MLESDDNNYAKSQVLQYLRLKLKVLSVCLKLSFFGHNQCTKFHYKDKLKIQTKLVPRNRDWDITRGTKDKRMTAAQLNHHYIYNSAPTHVCKCMNDNYADYEDETAKSQQEFEGLCIYYNVMWQFKE